MAASSVLLPTPEPPKIPTRWPLPTGRRLSIARTPVTSGSTMCSRFERTRRTSVQVVERLRVDRGTAVHRLAESVQHASEQPRGNLHACGSRARDDGIARLQPGRVFERHQQHASVAEPNDLRANAAAAASIVGDVRISQKSLTAAAGPCEAINSPASSRTRPVHSMGSTESTAAR